MEISPEGFMLMLDFILSKDEYIEMMLLGRNNLRYPAVAPILSSSSKFAGQLLPEFLARRARWTETGSADVLTQFAHLSCFLMGE